MVFVWVQNIGIGASIDSADVQEIRNNIDFVDDNRCGAHNAGVQVGDDNGVNVGDDVGEHVGDDLGVNVGDNAGANIGVDISQDIGDDVGVNTGEDISEDAPHNVMHDLVDHDPYNSAQAPSNLFSDMSSDDSSHKSDHVP